MIRRKLYGTSKPVFLMLVGASESRNTSYTHSTTSTACENRGTNNETSGWQCERLRPYPHRSPLSHVNTLNDDGTRDEGWRFQGNPQGKMNRNSKSLTLFLEERSEEMCPSKTRTSAVVTIIPTCWLWSGLRETMAFRDILV